MKLIGDFNDHYMVQHFDGSTFPVAKKGISEEMHKKIKAFGSKEPIKMADGGLVPGLDANSSSLPSQPADNLADLQAPTQPVAMTMPSDFALAKGVSPTEMNQPVQDSSSIFDTIKKNLIPGGALPTHVSAVSSAPSAELKQPETSELKKASYETGIPEHSSPLGDPFKEQMNGISKQQGDVSSFSKQMNDANSMAQTAQNDLSGGLKKIDQATQAHMEALKQAGAQLSDAFMNGKIDPHRFYNNMSTGNKVMAAVSLALGGIGSGLTGKPNAALDVINGAIQRDMESQRSDMERQRQGVTMNHEAQRDEMQDYSLKKASLISAAQAQIGLATMKSQNAQAALNGKVMIQGLENQKQQLMQEYSLKKGVMEAVQQSPGNGAVLAHAVSVLIPKEEQKDAYKELDRVQAAVEARDKINKFFGSATDKNTVMGRIMHGGFEPADMKALEANVMPVIKDLEGKVNEKEMEVLHGLYPTPGDSASKIKTKMAGLNDFISSKSKSSLLESHGLMPRNVGIYDENGKKKFSEGAPR